MGEAELRAAADRLETAENRLAALHEHGLDVGALVAQLAFARSALRNGQVAESEAICDEVLAAAKRMGESDETPRRSDSGRLPRSGGRDLAADVRQVLDQGLLAKAMADAGAVTRTEFEARLNQVATTAGGDTSDLERRLLSDLDWRIETIMAENGGLNVVQLDAKLDDLRQRLPELVGASLDATRAQIMEDVLRQVRDKTVADSARQRGEWIAEAVAQSRAAFIAAGTPSDAALKTLHEQVAADLEWRIEKVAAEHGWCTVGDVESIVHKALAGSGPSSATPDFSRLEAALSEFVRQTLNQQQQFISALQDRFERGTAAIVNRLAPAGIIPRNEHAGTESGALDAVDARAVKAAAELLSEQALDLQPSEEPRKSTEALAHPAPAADPNDQVDKTETRGTRKLQFANPPAAAAGTGIFTEAAAEEFPAARPVTEVGSRSIAKPGSGISSEQILAMIRAEFDRRETRSTVPAGSGDDAALHAALVRLLPAVLGEPAVANRIFSLICLEAIDHPGALGEVTGLRAFLRKELTAMRNAHESVAAPV